MYKRLAKYYDALLKDDEAVTWWKDFTDKHQAGSDILELAAGTGEITLKLAKDYKVVASDLSLEMLEQIKLKDIDNSIESIKQLNMLDLTEEAVYSNVVCYCDSINYIDNYSDLQLVFKNVYRALKTNGVFMFDMHTKDRLEEFKEPFIEVGQLHNVDYQWSITTEGEYIYHHFVFYEDDMIQEYHTQMVFDITKVLNMLEKIGFELKVYTDFDKEGLHVGEKIFIVGKKL